MSNAPDQVRKRAIKRLMQDLKEIQDSPVENVSAAPLDNDMFEWHCNFQFGDAVYHLILFFPKKYPYDSPSAEFVPMGYQFTGGATMNGKKGVKACLSIFSDFANIHTEWANEKGMGWSPGYTVQTILLNLVSFIAETHDRYGAGGSAYMDTIIQRNAKLANGFTCKDCGHTAKKIYPPFEGKGSGKGKGSSSKKTVGKVDDGMPQIVDYISKLAFNPKSKPKGTDELFGYGVVISGSASRPSFTTPCEFLTGESYYGMKKAMGVVHSMMKDELKLFLPMYLTESHGSQIQKQIEACLTELMQIMPSCKKASLSKMVIKTIPNLMSATVVEFSKGTQHTSDNHLNGYFALHRLFLWAIETYPDLQNEIDNKLKDFIENEDRRSKSACPHIGEWLMLLSASSKYKWQDAGSAYLSESWKRQVMWYVKDDAKLGMLDTDKTYRLNKTLDATAVSRKLLSFQVLFLDIAMPKNMNRKQIIDRYDKTMGFPTPDMVKQMKEAVAKIDKMKTYSDWFTVLKLDPPTDDEIFDRLHNSVEFAINTNGYKWTFWKNQGGWAAVLKKYPDGTPGWKGGKAKPGKAVAAAAGGDTEGKGKGKGKKSKPKEEVVEEDVPVPVAAKGKGRGRGSKGAKAVAMEVDEPVVGKKGKGRGKRKADEPLEEEEEEKPKKAGGKGRGGKKVKFEEEKILKKQPSRTGPAKGRGRGKGKKK